MLPHRISASASLLLAALLSVQGVHAADPVSAGDEIAHTVQEGDTLDSLARAYLAAPEQWRQLQVRNKVANPRRLQPGSVLWIPVRLQPAETAKVAFVHGQVTSQTGATGAVETVDAGGQLSEGTTLKVGPDSFIAVELADGTIVRVQAQSDVQLRQLRRRGRAGSLQSVLEMQRGAVESSVPPSRDPHRRFELRTPRAVTSVRGTRFNVATTESGQTTAAVLDGSVAVGQRRDESPAGQVAPAPASALLAPGQGVAVAADGTVGTPRQLLPAPDTSTLPEKVGDASLLALDVPQVPGAVTYEAHLARDQEFTNVLRHGRFADGRLRWRTVDDGRYYLSVRAVDDAGIPGVPAIHPLIVKTRPIAPLHQAPAPGAIVAQGSGELRCTQVPDVRWYRIQIATDAQFTQPVVDEQRLTDCSVPLASLPVGSYHWRMASLQELSDGQADQGPFSAGQPFSIATRPASLSLQSLQAQDGDSTVRLNWPGQPGQRFRLQLAHAADPSFESIVLDSVLDAPEWTADSLSAGEYLVRIQVLDPTGLISDFSPARKIRAGSVIQSGSGLPVSSSSGQPVGRP